MKKAKGTVYDHMSMKELVEYFRKENNRQDITESDVENYLRMIGRDGEGIWLTPEERKELDNDPRYVVTRVSEERN